MVEAGGSEDFGDMTMGYLHKLKVRHGIMLAVCTLLCQQENFRFVGLPLWFEKHVSPFP